MSKKRTITLIIIAILIMITLGLRIAYSFLEVKVEPESSTSNVSIKSCLEINLDDSDSKAINLVDTYPMSDSKGLETESYQFKVSSSCEGYVGFNLYLTTIKENEIEDTYIKFAVTTINDEVLIMDNLVNTTKITNELTSDELRQIDIGLKEERKNIYKVYSNNIPLQGESTYKLHIWVDKDAGNETMGQSFKVGLSVKPYDREETLAENIIKNKDNTLIYHDGLPDYDNMENSELEAGDYSYRYVGSNPNNYVCLDGTTTEEKCETDDDLYRIIGLFKNDLNLYEIKLIKAQRATAKELGDKSTNISEENQIPSAYYVGDSYCWNSSNGTTGEDNNTTMWKESNLNKVNLNSYFYNYITKRAKYLQNHITEHTWTTGGFAANDVNAKVTYDLELGEKKVKAGDNVCYTQGNVTDKRPCVQEDIEYTAHIGLMYISDYMYGTIPSNWIILASEYKNEEVKNSNWMYEAGGYYWSISRYSSRGDLIWTVDHTGNANIKALVINFNRVRPSFYITSDAKISEGEGTYEKPYRLSFN